MLWVFQVAEFLNQLYFKNEWSISMVFWILIKMQRSLILILRYCQMFRFINKLYVNMESVNQCNDFAWRFVICK